MTPRAELPGGEELFLARKRTSAVGLLFFYGDTSENDTHSGLETAGRRHTLPAMPVIIFNLHSIARE